MHLLGEPAAPIELETENILIIAGNERAGLPNNPFNAFTHLTAARCCEYARREKATKANKHTHVNVTAYTRAKVLITPV